MAQVSVFDLTQTPNLIAPDLGFIAIFVAAGSGILVASLLLRRFRQLPGVGHERVQNLARVCLPFSLFYLALTGCMFVVEFIEAHGVRADVEAGRYVTLEGCLESFRAGRAIPNNRLRSQEKWTLSGHHFSYGSNEVRFAYHKVEPLGGIVHADSYVRVSFVPDGSSGRDDIVLLEARRHACPAAPDLTGLPPSRPSRS